MHLEKETIMRITTRRHVGGGDGVWRTGRSLSCLALTSAVVGAVALAPPPAHAQQVCSNPALAIPDNTPACVTDDIRDLVSLPRSVRAS